jgi:hypothetical protein
VADKVGQEVLGFSIVYMTILFGNPLLLAGHGPDLVTSFSAVMASISYIGPGLVDPMAHIGSLPDAVKLRLVSNGRLGAGHRPQGSWQSDWQCPWLRRD